MAAGCDNDQLTVPESKNSILQCAAIPIEGYKSQIAKSNQKGIALSNHTDTAGINFGNSQQLATFQNQEESDPELGESYFETQIASIPLTKWNL